MNLKTGLVFGKIKSLRAYVSYRYNFRAVSCPACWYTGTGASQSLTVLLPRVPWRHPCQMRDSQIQSEARYDRVVAAKPGKR